MASRISRKVCTLGRPGALGTGRWGSIQDHSASDKSVWYALLMLGTLPSHLLKAPFRTVSEGEFCEPRPNGVLRSLALLNGGGFFTAPAYEGVQTALSTYKYVYPNCQRLKLGLRGCLRSGLEQ